MVSAETAVAGQLAEVARLLAEGGEAVRHQRGGAALLAELDAAGCTSTGLGGLLERDDVIVVTGCIDAVPVGVAVAELVAVGTLGPVARVRALYVEPEAREVGVAEALMDRVLAWAGSAGCTAVEADALPGDRATKNLFERYGLVARKIVVRRDLDEAGEAP